MDLTKTVDRDHEGRERYLSTIGFLLPKVVSTRDCLAVHLERQTDLGRAPGAISKARALVAMWSIGAAALRDVVTSARDTTIISVRVVDCSLLRALATQGAF